jgi:hypothetical protein
MTTLMTSLAEIKSFNPCPEGWRDILKGQGKTQADDVLFPLSDCLKSNTFADVYWLLGKRKVEIQICVKAAKICANSVAHLKNKWAANAAAYAYAANAAADAAYAANAAADAAYADAAAADAAYAAAYADAAAADAAYAAADTDTDAYAYAYANNVNTQREKNKSFLLQAIQSYESEN